MNEAHILYGEISDLAAEFYESAKSLPFECDKLFTCAESCTGGMLSAALTDVPGISEFFPGSVVTYSNIAKIERLNVTPETIANCGAVSGQCAAEMAYGAAKLYNAKIAVSVTGIAGPTGGTVDKPVGTVWFGLAIDGKVVKLARGSYLNRSRKLVRLCATRFALKLLIDGLTELHNMEVGS